MLMISPPVSGKTMLARRLPGILPDLVLDEALEVTKIYSIAGMLRPELALIRPRLFTLLAMGYVTLYPQAITRRKKTKARLITQSACL